MSIKSIFESYYDNQAEIVLLSYDLEMIENDGYPSSSSCFLLGEPRSSQVTGQPTENTAVKNIDNQSNVDAITKRRNIVMCEVATVDQLIELLNPEEVKIWELRIKEKNSWAKIADTLNKDSRTVQSTYDCVFKRLEQIHVRRFEKETG